MLEPFQYDFFVRGMIATGLVGGLCALIGVYIVLRGMAYIGHGLSHAIFGGAVVTYVMSFNYFIGASLWGFLSAILITLTTRKSRIGADAAIGIVTTASSGSGDCAHQQIQDFHPGFRRRPFRQHFGSERGRLGRL